LELDEAVTPFFEPSLDSRLWSRSSLHNQRAAPGIATPLRAVPRSRVEPTAYPSTRCCQRFPPAWKRFGLPVETKQGIGP